VTVVAEEKHIIILANSARSGKHCVAGKELIPDGKGRYDIGPWIRLTDPRESDGAVPAASTRYQSGGFARTFDVAKVPLQGHCEDADHPEDWFFEPTKPWTFVERGDPTVLPTLADNPKTVWHEGYEDKSVPAGYVRRMSANPATLYLIKAPVGWAFNYWKEWNSFLGRNKTVRQLLFTYANQSHEFSVTDTAFTSRHNIYNKATETQQTITARKPSEVFFCLSLTRLTPPDFNRTHYKICATIFEQQ